MAKGVNREKVRVNMPTQQVGVSSSSNRDSFRETNRVEPEVSGVTKLMGAIGDVLPAASKIYADKVQKDIEEDKTVQESRATMGLLPTEGATEEGMLAYKAVGVRNKAISELSKLKERAKTFEGTDEEWEAEIATAQRNTIDTLGSGSKLIEASADIFRQQMPSIMTTRVAAQSAQREQDEYRINADSLKNSVNLATSPEHARANIAQTLKEMDMQGVSNEMTEKTIVDTAVFMANESDDLTLIDFIKEQTNWYQENPILMKAEESAVNRAYVNSYGEIAQTKSDIETKYSNNRYLTEDDWYKEAGGLDKHGKKIYSVEQLRAGWNRINKANNDEYTVDTLFRHTLASQDNPSADPLPFIAGKITPKVAKGVIDKWDVAEAEKMQSYIDANPDASPEEIVQFKNLQVNNKATMLSKLGIQDPNWKAQFKSLEEVDLSSLNPGVDAMPNGVRNSLSIMDALDDSASTLAAHASTKALAIHSNFKKNILLGYDEVSAFQLAHKVANGTRTVTTTDRKTLSSKAKESVGDLYDRYFFESGSDIGSKQRELVEYGLTARAEELVAGGITLDDAVDMATREYDSGHFQLSSGAVIKGDISNIAREMGVSIENADKFLSELPANISGDFDIDDDFVLNPNVPIEEWIPVIKPNGLVVYTDYTGMPVTKPLTLGEVRGKSIKKQIEEEDNKPELIEASRRKTTGDNNYYKIKPTSKWSK